MNETEFLIGRDGLDLVDDFYPDDLPSEWRFDYYSNQFRTLCLPIDTQEDLEEIFEALEESTTEKSDEKFELVLSISAQLLANVSTLEVLLDAIKPYKSLFTLFCELDSPLNTKILPLLKGYQVAFQAQSEVKLKLKLQTRKVAEKYLYYNHLPVLYTQNSWDEKQIRTYVEQVAVINTRTILICKNAEKEALEKIKVIAQILGF
ncbi:hypothetical protein [Candidatus Thioglobus sp.]|uniref:hypothetical protein n=1 Tax=Candidatus Thioglobus sp. TaxID=2026721 RepID=UPI003D0F3201